MPRKLSEERTRKEMIDPQLENAGWYLRDHSKVKILGRQFERFTPHHNYNADLFRFLRAAQSVFLQKRHLVTADLYEPLLDMFGADAVERWFTEKEMTEFVKFTNGLAVN